ncbi:MAG: ABC transporter ATP-binding protein [bacterium]|nr:ABC transporter ATP-binding protein [bacterium]
MCILEFNNTHRSYGSQEVLGGIDLQVQKGDVLGLLGRNGAGKTTLIKLMMGLLAPDKGQVRVFGLDPREKPVQVKKRIGYVSEDQELPPFLKVSDVIQLYRGLFSTWDEKFAADLANRFELPSDRKIKDLSRGQARQVALLCAVSHRPELLILDEPAGGLDPAARRDFLETSIRLLNEEGTTIVFSSHHMNDVERLASRLVMIHEKEKWIDSDLDDIRQGYCLAQIPQSESLDPEVLLANDHCLCARQAGEAVHAVFEMDPDSCQSVLAKDFLLKHSQCRTINLEEMFIELVRRSS